MIKSPIGYPGGKFKALNDIMELVPYGIEDWREPFFGGGSVTIGFLQDIKSKDCKRFIVGDLYTEMYKFWTGVQKNPNKVIELVKEWWTDATALRSELIKYPTDTKEYKEVYDKIVLEGRKLWAWATSVDCNTLTLEERAARMYLLNKTSFSATAEAGSMSLVRTVAFNTEQTKGIADISRVLQRVEIYNTSFENTMANVDKDKTFIFLDPPYYTQESSGLYGKDGSTHKGFPHKKLADLCDTIECKWLMTYDDSIFIRQLYNKHNIVPLVLRYSMVGNDTEEDALKGEEVFIANYNISNNSSFDVLDALI